MNVLQLYRLENRETYIREFLENFCDSFFEVVEVFDAELHAESLWQR
jgi:hypothetical protein